MTAELLLASLIASTATLALTLAAARIGAVQPASTSMASKWASASRFQAAILISALLVTSALGAGALLNRNADGSSQFAALAAAQGAFGQPDAAAGASRDRAIEELRKYTDNIKSKTAPVPPPQTMAGSSGTDESGSLPDVETMIARLASRLKTEPGDARGWRMLGWSYFNTSRYPEAVAAYERAVALLPDDRELFDALNEARARNGNANADAAAKQSEDDPSATGGQQQLPGPEDAAFIRGMVDRLAGRLQSNPHDAEGWIKLMRARIVLGQVDAAREALRRALASFEADRETRDHILASATGLGLHAY